jgi:hypothetical protein
MTAVSQSYPDDRNYVKLKKMKINYWNGYVSGVKVLHGLRGFVKCGPDVLIVYTACVTLGILA